MESKNVKTYDHKKDGNKTQTFLPLAMSRLKECKEKLHLSQSAKVFATPEINDEKRHSVLF